MVACLAMSVRSRPRTLGLRAGAGGSGRGWSEGATNTVSCTRQNPSEARRHPYETCPPRRPRCSLIS